MSVLRTYIAFNGFRKLGKCKISCFSRISSTVEAIVSSASKKNPFTLACFKAGNGHFLLSKKQLYTIILLQQAHFPLNF